MTNLISEFWLGITCSFLGTLPLSLLNLNILKLGLEGKQKSALLFSLGATGVELGQILFTLLSMQFLLKIPHLTPIMTLIFIPVLIVMGVKMWKAKPLTVVLGQDKSTVSKTDDSEQSSASVKQGALLSLANFLTYPFWLLWGNVFVQNGWLDPQPLDLTIFSLGASLGTFGAFACFLILGKIVNNSINSVQKMNRVQKNFNRFVGATFLCFALIQIVKLFNF